MYKNPTDYFMHVIAKPSVADRLAAAFSRQVCMPIGPSSAAEGLRKPIKCD